jgi:hypothetical protein
VVSEYASVDDDAVGDLYTGIVQDYPKDTLALSLAFIHNSPARRRALLDNSGAAMGAWEPPSSSEPGDLYPFLLAEHAYSLGENEEYEESERLARLALKMEPTCALATHQSESRAWQFGTAFNSLYSSRLNRCKIMSDP